MITISTLLHLQDELRKFSTEKLTLGFKYKLEIYFEKLKTLTAPVETQRVALINELSKGTGKIEPEIEVEGKPNKPNPIFEEFVNQYKELLETKIELPESSFKIPFTLIENLESEHSYPLIFKYLIDAPESN